MKLDEVLWTYGTTYKTPIRMIPYKLIYEKSCHLLVELKHTPYYTIKTLNLDLKTASGKRKLQMSELDELRL